ncbi:MAG: polyisoprenoid-binding protein [Calditrichaeota bacterium]|nr:MAG: polyisoprenoid-binding protein [Calditrichota bacterium]
MKRTIPVLSIVLLSTALFAGKTWRLVPEQSSLDFSTGLILVLPELSNVEENPQNITRVNGHFADFQVRLIQESEDFSRGRVEARIDAASIFTGNTSRDRYLTSKDFLDVENFPQIVFVGKQFVPLGNNMYLIKGQLTIKDVTRPVTLRAHLAEKGKNRLRFSAATEIDRYDFGLKWRDVLESGAMRVNRRIDIKIDAVFVPEL